MCKFTAGATEKAGRVLRGGSWNNNNNNCQVSVRNNNNPNNRNNNNGFRLSQCFPFGPEFAGLRPGRVCH
ncbi:MAG: hypothetical protein IT259_14195 [Saprospiraceae bacterium]|nr:hypothetical protein [Saprospiraceae bacterium]